jgi:hypothetical protein
LQKCYPAAKVPKPSLSAAGIALGFWFVPRVSLLQRGGVDFSRFVLRSEQKQIELVGLQLLAGAANTRRMSKSIAAPGFR